MAVERRSRAPQRTLMEVVGCMLKASSLPNSMWGMAMINATYLRLGQCTVPSPWGCVASREVVRPDAIGASPSAVRMHCLCLGPAGEADKVGRRYPKLPPPRVRDGRTSLAPARPGLSDDQLSPKRRLRRDHTYVERENKKKLRRREREA